MTIVTRKPNAGAPADRYQQFTLSPVGQVLVKRLGLPNPTPLRRYRSGQPLLTGPALVGGTANGRLTDRVSAILAKAGVELATAPGSGSDERLGALVFDATGVKDPAGLHALYEFFQPAIARLGSCARVVVLGTQPELTSTADEQIAQRALEGFTRSVGKELRRGGTAQLVYVAPGAEGSVESTVRFLLSAKSAYVSGQVIRVWASQEPAGSVDWERPLADQVAVVTGAARGIGAAIARVLSRDGAHVVCVDIPAAGGDLSSVANEVGGSALQLDITAKDAPNALAEHVLSRHGGVDIVVHNAGITRDKTLARMDAGRWDSVISVNLESPLRINEGLLAAKALRNGGRIIGVSSIAGIAGNLGQTNYGASKAGVIGMINAYAPELAEQGFTINAVAPGFIETKMTAAIPLMIREVGRRLNSMSQGGLPVDVAEAIAWYANPASAAVNGNVVRVCGQSLLGA
jgi:3-oxoacyl-[acyl-carrier protein] reductase